VVLDGIPKDLGWLTGAAYEVRVSRSLKGPLSAGDAIWDAYAGPTATESRCWWSSET
jgi:hypothetical protein